MQEAKATIQRLPLAARGAVLCGLLAFFVSVTVSSTWYDSTGMARVESYDFAQFGLGLLAVTLAYDGVRALEARRHPKTPTVAACALAGALGLFHLMTSWDLGAPLSAI